MKLKATIILAFATFFNLALIAQQITPVEVSRQAYDSIKAVNPAYFEGKIIVIAGNNHGPAFQPVIQPNKGGSRASGCNLLQAITDTSGNLIDNTYNVVPLINGNTVAVPPQYRCDDNTTDEILLPFSFCFFGETYNSIFISSNGLVSFGAEYPSFLPVTLPSTAATFVAPFWADVDTRNTTSGIVYYKITPTSCIVQWNRVGYYASQANLRNTFQVIITDGTDPILSGNANVAFSYGDMQWAVGSTQYTTGGGGFNSNPGSGNPTSVCTNIANLNTFIQFGRFDRPGSAYDGPFGATDGIDYLDNRDIIFNNCVTNSNIAPIPNITELCNGLTDTVCIGEVVPFSFGYFSGEDNQTVDVTITPATPGLSYTSTPNGSIANVQGTFTGGVNNIGLNSLIITATDGGSPAAISTSQYNIFVKNVSVNPVITATEDTICPNENTTLSLTASYPSQIWSPGGATTPALTVNTPGQYIVTVFQQGCSVKDTFKIVPHTPLPLSITGANATCSLGSVTLQATAGFTNYNWSPVVSNTNTVTGGPNVYNVTANDPNGCVTAALPFTVIAADPVLTIIGPDPAVTCFNAPVTLTAHVEPPANNYSYSWSPNIASTDSTIQVPSGTYTATYTDISGLCTDTQTITIENVAPTVTISGNVPFCPEDSILLALNNSFTTYQWYINDQPITGGNNFIYASDSVEYKVVVTFKGCSATDSVNVDPIAKPVANFATNPQFGGVAGEPVQFIDKSGSAEDAIVAWNWDFVSGLPISSTQQNPTSVFPTPSDNVPVTLIVTTQEGCKDTITLPVQVVPDAAPNVITPNDDEYNQALVFPVAFVKPNCQLFIYNRWGHKVFYSDNYKNDWEGENHTDGVYYFVFLQPDGKEHHGSVTVLKNK